MVDARHHSAAFCNGNSFDDFITSPICYFLTPLTHSVLRISIFLDLTVQATSIITTNFTVDYNQSLLRFIVIIGYSVLLSVAKLWLKMSAHNRNRESSKILNFSLKYLKYFIYNSSISADNDLSKGQVNILYAF